MNRKPEGKQIERFTELVDDYATIIEPTVRVRKLPAPTLIATERRQQFAALLDQWIVCALVLGSDRRSKVWAEFFQTLSRRRLLQIDDDTDQFFSGCLDRAMQIALEVPSSGSLPDNQYNVEDCVKRGAGGAVEAKSDERTSVAFATPPDYDFYGPSVKPIDALAKMIVAMMRLIDPSQISPVLILQRALSVIARSIHR